MYQVYCTVMDNFLCMISVYQVDKLYKVIEAKHSLEESDRVVLALR